MNAEEPLQEGSFIQREPDEESISDEKFDFPSTRDPIPRFSVTFGSNSNAPLPGQIGPRFFNQSAVPFGRPVDIESGKNSSVDHPGSSLTRQGSEHSTWSQHSSTVSMDAPSIGRSRWIIE